MRARALARDVGLPHFFDTCFNAEVTVSNIRQNTIFAADSGTGIPSLSSVELPGVCGVSVSQITHGKIGQRVIPSRCEQSDPPPHPILMPSATRRFWLARTASQRRPKTNGIRVACEDSFSCRCWFFEKRTRVRFSVLLVFVFAAKAAFAAENAGESAPTVTFDDALTSAFIALLAALTTYIGSKSHLEKKAIEKIKVEQDRQPPLGEDTAKTYATKDDLRGLDRRLSDDINQMRTQIDDNDKSLRDLIQKTNKDSEDRAIGTHARIEVLYRAQIKQGRLLGIIIGQLSVLTKQPVSISDTEEG